MSICTAHSHTVPLIETSWRVRQKLSLSEKSSISFNDFVQYFHQAKQDGFGLKCESDLGM